MKTQSAFVRSDRAVHLDTKAAVHLHAALVVEPRYAEHQHALRLYDPVENAVRLILGMLGQHQPRESKTSRTA